MKRVKIPKTVKPILETVGRVAQDQGVQAYAVGGCVRDWLLGITSTVDVDVTIEGDGIALAGRLAETFGVTPRAHAQFGTATLELPKRLRLDVASCRKETYREPAAYPTVSRGALRDDLFRRDFTINAMAIALNPHQGGTLIDPFHGLRDLRQRRLRILHARSFVDDPSRILRAARFAPRFGLRLERATAQQMFRALADGLLGRLNRGRLRKEFERMAAEPHPRACLICLGQWLAGDVG
ncbi:MAG: CCA tRNA nucleotidyltransferase [Candidatus Omnitrophica bacterium]|nr:CCA tRNA nucleotidyltransferase [Candidatus Omnitrophota bacterium]